MATKAPVPDDDRVVVLPLRGQPCTLIQYDRTKHKEAQTIETDFGKWLRDYVLDKGPWSMVVIDPLSRFAGTDAETDNSAGTRYIQALEAFASSGPTIIGSHHTNKMSRSNGNGTGPAVVNTSSARGSTSITDGARWCAVMSSERLQHEDETDQQHLSEVVTLAPDKSNVSRRAEPVLLRRDLDHGGALLPLDDIDLKRVTEARVRAAKSKGSSPEEEQERIVREDAALERIFAYHAPHAPDMRTFRAEMKAEMAGDCSPSRAYDALARRHLRLRSAKD
jgi:hypothetical protein